MPMSDDEVAAALADAYRLSARGDSQLAGNEALGILVARPDHAEALALVEQILADGGGPDVETFVARFPDTPDHRALKSRLESLEAAAQPLPTFDEPLVHDDRAATALLVRLAGLRERGCIGEATFRYRAAFGGFPSLTDAKLAVESDPIPLPEGYAYPAPPPPDPEAQLETEVVALIAKHDKRGAIRLVMERTGVAFAAAKARVDRLG
jgi:hypothetical protein